MTPTRREFIKSAGVAIASLVLARCTSPAKSVPTSEATRTLCYSPITFKPTPSNTPTPTLTRDLPTPSNTSTPTPICYRPTATPGAPTSTAQLTQQTNILTDAVESGQLDPETAAQARAAIRRERLRACWLQLEQFAQQSTTDFQRNVQLRDELIAEHQIAVNDLVNAGELEAAVAEQVHIAFHAAAHNVWYMSYPLNICYTPTPTGFTPQPVGAAEVELANYIRASAGQIMRQAEILAEMAQNSALDAATVAQAQATLERDMALLSLSDAGGRSGTERAIARSHLSDEQTWALYDRLAGSDPYNLPRFDELGLEIPPEAAQAAQFLIELLLN